MHWGDSMKAQLICDIDQYISYLNDMGLYVSVHGKGIGGLLEHNIHRSPFCTLVKTDSAAWHKCVRCQQKVFQQHKKGCLFGMCYAGMEEYVFFVNEKTFVSVSGYGIDKERATERINQLSDEFYLKRSALMRVYNNSLKHEKEDLTSLTTLIKPLCHMLRLLQMMLADIPVIQTKSSMFDSLLAYVQYHFMEELSVRSIAQACACSESTVQHLFKQHTGKSPQVFITEIRLNQAKNLLKTTELPISTVAQMCGYTNINYFSTAFRRNIGISPGKFRANAEMAL